MATIVRSIKANGAFERAVREAAGRAIKPKLDLLARQIPQSIDSIVEREFNTGRDGDRRRPGGHLHGSFRASVTRGTGNVFAVIEITSDAPAVKVNSLNNGSRPHEIGAGKKVSFPTTDYGGQYKKSAKFFAARKNASITSSTVVDGPVQHPGTIGSFFMQRGAESAIRSVFKVSVRFPRGGH